MTDDGATLDWQPRPDPAISDPARPGLRAHRHRGDQLASWVFLQHQVWVDYWGNEHEIESMPFDYVENVIAFCEQRAERIRLIVALELMEAAVAGLVTGEVAAVEELANLDKRVPAFAWLSTTPLMAALRHRCRSR